MAVRKSRHVRCQPSSIIQNDDTLVEMTHQPYTTEDHLQRFLERYPIAGRGAG